ncbi:hypothetical protein OAD66_01240 [Bacteroidia bacterium]|nr:hypothetical protein [Bacteroidia bacterium]MDB9881740.1 hypothetical protein [Bacteroidia bacterium]
MNRSDDEKFGIALIAILSKFIEQFRHKGVSQTSIEVVDEYNKCIVVLDEYILDTKSKFHKRERELLPTLTTEDYKVVARLNEQRPVWFWILAIFPYTHIIAILLSIRKDGDFQTLFNKIETIIEIFRRIVDLMKQPELLEGWNNSFKNGNQQLLILRTNYHRYNREPKKYNVMLGSGLHA